MTIAEALSLYHNGFNRRDEDVEVREENINLLTCFVLSLKIYKLI